VGEGKGSCEQEMKSGVGGAMPWPSKVNEAPFTAPSSVKEAKCDPPKGTVPKNAEWLSVEVKELGRFKCK